MLRHHTQIAVLPCSHFPPPTSNLSFQDHPGFPNQPRNGPHYLIRDFDATGDWAPVYDPAHPVPVSRSLDATRRVLLSPFPEDQRRVLHFCGYDGPYADNLSAWVYKGNFAIAHHEKP